MECPETLDAVQEQEVERQLVILKRGTAEILPEAELQAKLARSIVEKIPLKVKCGLDPSAPDIHIGHTVVLQKLRQFQELGHTVQLVIGDFTGRIGDPTGKSETRKPLMEPEIKANAKTYIEQLGKVVDIEKVDVYFNSKWLSPMDFSTVIQLAARMTVARVLERDDFERRFKRQQAIYLHEFFYPLMQGYDSIALKSDIEIGGTDQKFNLLMGRHLQESFDLEKQVIIMMPLLVGVDGQKKMSKSLGNYIGIDEPPNDIFGKCMSLPDALMLKYMALATPLSHDELDRLELGLKTGAVHPLNVKLKMAKMFVALFHGEQAADEAAIQFQHVFQERQLPSDIPEFIWEKERQISGIDLLVAIGFFTSKSGARRMIDNGGIRIDGKKLLDSRAELIVKDGMIVQVGKRRFAKLIINEGE